jgi:hypothetical protein
MFPLTTRTTCLVLTFVTTAARAETSNFRAEFLPHLLKGVPGMLKSQDPATGRFGTSPWICTDQNVVWPLAVAWSMRSDANPYYHNPDVLAAIVKGGDALIADMNSAGQWTFRKKDGSTWGQIYMPWTYSRWIRAFGINKTPCRPMPARDGKKRSRSASTA